ncbi:hypothetical protein GCM10010121_041450 [Streptomyces brasiliensis]|uniref:Uncharacterized protein n=1 Tax=Streptomyces brasiliensis TaxID=1954 RepID=A0A917KR38_9ACTN|nr:hypothetical protein GCM10010121_041450 [Streptomyces brasiliensis]
MWLSVWGLGWAIFGMAAFALVGRPGWAAACGVLWVVATIDMTMILRHIRQGPHYQPGRDVPPYAPPDGRPPYRPARSRPPYRFPPQHRHP